MQLESTYYRYVNLCEGCNVYFRHKKGMPSCLILLHYHDFHYGLKGIHHNETMYSAPKQIC